MSLNKEYSKWDHFDDEVAFINFTSLTSRPAFTLSLPHKDDDEAKAQKTATRFDTGDGDFTPVSQCFVKDDHKAKKLDRKEQVLMLSRSGKGTRGYGSLLRKRPMHALTTVHRKLRISTTGNLANRHSQVTSLVCIELWRWGRRWRNPLQAVLHHGKQPLSVGTGH
jgi:hypothetical protein